MTGKQRSSPQPGTTLDGEHWKPIPQFVGYEVSNFGRVRAVTLIKPKTVNGYLTVDMTLSTSGRRKTKMVHRLVAEAFVGPQPSAAHEVAHGDGVRHNANSENLRWATRKDNHADKVRHGTKLMGSRVASAKLNSMDVVCIRALRRQGRTFRSLSEEYGVSAPAIRSIVSLKTWAHITDHSRGITHV